MAGLLDAASFKSYTSTDYSIDPEVKRKEQEREREREEEEEEKAFYNIRAVEGDSSDDSYYLISTKDKDSEFPIGLDVPGNAQLDVDALAEKLASLEPSTVAELSGGEVRSPAYSQAAAGAVGGRKIEGAGVGSSEFVEVHLEGGAEHRVPVSVEQMGSVVAWQFSTQPKGIAFGISFAATQGRKEEEVRGGARAGRRRGLGLTNLVVYIVLHGWKEASIYIGPWDATDHGPEPHQDDHRAHTHVLAELWLLINPRR